MIPTGWYIFHMTSESIPAPTASARERLLGAAIRIVREKGFGSTSVDDLCRDAGVTKGGFFHHFASKQALGVAAAAAWRDHAATLFDTADYRSNPDPVARVLAYVAHRAALIEGSPAEFSCLAGTMVQELHASDPVLRDACRDAIFGHADSLAGDFDAALAARGIAHTSGVSLARHVQAVLQGGFIMAKASGDAGAARDAVVHLQSYLRLLFDEGDRQ
jgi:TetR/AcrR family transcriptional repressor of nem operon